MSLTYVHLSLYSIENTCKYSYCIYHAYARWEYGRRDESLLHTRKYMNRSDSVCIHSSRVTDPCLLLSDQIHKETVSYKFETQQAPFLHIAHSRFVFNPLKQILAGALEL
jgi:hypothetical protein